MVTSATPNNPVLNILDTENLKLRLQSFPALLADAKKKIAGVRGQFNDANDGLKAAKAILMREISDEVNPINGKARFTNQEAREAEFVSRSKNDFNYQEALKWYREAEEVLQAAEGEYEQLQYQWMALCKVADIVAGEIALLSRYVVLVPELVDSQE